MSAKNELGDLPDEALIETSQQVEALNSDLRLRILKLASEPASVRQIADQLAMPITRLYYHVNLLEAAGYLDVVDSRKSGARIEKIYRVAARNFTPGPKLAENIDDVKKTASALAGLVLGPARAGAEAALAARISGGPLDGVIGRAIVDLTAGQFEHFRTQLEDLIANASKADVEPGAETQAYSLTAVLLPVDPQSSNG